MDNNPIRFSRKDSAQFFRTLNKRVNQYFNENKIKKTGNWKLHLKTIVMFSIFLTPYFLILTLNLPILGLYTPLHHHGGGHGRSGHERDARWQPRGLFQQESG